MVEVGDSASEESNRSHLQPSPRADIARQDDVSPECDSVKSIAL